MNGERRETRVKRGNEHKYKREKYFSSSFSLLSPIHPHPRVCPPARVYACVCMRPPGEKVKPGALGGPSPCPSDTCAYGHRSRSRVKGWGNGLPIDGSAVFCGTSNGSSAGRNASRRARERSPFAPQFVLPVRFSRGTRRGAPRRDRLVEVGKSRVPAERSRPGAQGRERGATPERFRAGMPWRCQSRPGWARRAMPRQGRSSPGLRKTRHQSERKEAQA